MLGHVGPSCGGCVSTLRVGVQLSAGLCQGTRTRLSPTRGKGPHAPQYTHTKSALPRVAQARDTRAHVASLALNPRRYVLSAVRDAKHSNAERSTARARETCTTHTHNAAVRNTTGRIQHCMSTVSTATRCVHSRAFCLTSTSHRPPTLLWGFAYRVPLVQLVYRAAGVQLSAGLCQGTQTRLSPTRGKGPHAPQYTHTESALPRV